MPARLRLVVAGHGMAGHHLAEAVGGGWQVTVIGEEIHHAYDRVALTSVFSGVPAADLSLVEPGFYTGARTAVLGDAVVSIDRAGRSVTTRSGRTVEYDALVLATGSRPFVPPVPGHDLPGVFVYRTLDDAAAITAHARGCTAGIVVGGGLLGLEAAGALRDLGLQVRVIEFAPRLMPIQVDGGGGETLRRRIEALGVQVHVGTATTGITPSEDGLIVVAESAGQALQFETGIVVFATGVRPRDELARAAGLRIGERGGVATDAACRTSDQHIFAIGECASVEGNVYGLVAPGYAMAQVVAGQLQGGQAELGPQDLSTTLKLLGVEVASFGDAQARAPGALEVAYSDPVAGIYKKLVVTDDARTILGGILVGDASRYGLLKAMVGSSLTGAAADLLFEAGDPVSGSALPDSAQVCSCRNLSKGAICTAIGQQALADVGAVKKCTGAGTVCGSCVPMLKTLLAESGVAASTALCEHFDQTRAQLFDIVRVRGISTFTELITRHGTGRGCDICKPVVASILASLDRLEGAHILAGSQSALQDTNDKYLANIQRNGTYSVVPRIPGGEITPQKLIVIGEVARDFGLYTKITGGQRIDLFGARLEELPRIWERLVAAGFESGHAYGKALRTVKSCVGSTWCRYGVQDAVGLAVELELRYRGIRAPHKIKAGVSGCARECAEAQAKDFGVIATETGWNLFVGGNGGARPRHAELLIRDADLDTLVRTIDRFIIFYIRTADRLQRTAGWVESLEGGLEYLRSVIVDDSLGICPDLDAAMARHVEEYRDEWAAVLADPDRLRRFTSFVNAPGVPDPDISFVTERGQPRPATPADSQTDKQADKQADGRTMIAGPTLKVVGR